MRILVLGGTVFLGRHLVDAALARGHEVTIFTRGVSHPQGSVANVEHLIGNRDGGLDALRGRRFDSVIDTSGFAPRVVRQSAELLSDYADHYTFISSISVYADFSIPGLDESAPVIALDDPTSEDIATHYGGLKALCEQVVEESFPGRALHVRPGLIVGPYDKTDRFTYWPARVARGGAVLAPGKPGAPVQIIDARDLAEWTIRAAEAKLTGVFNATGPRHPYTMAEVLETCKQVSGSDARFTWIDGAFLQDQGVGEWVEMPLWIADPEMGGMLHVDIDAAVSAGLTFRPLADTVAATLAWDAARDPYVERKAGMNPDREAAVLEVWARRTGARSEA